MAAENYCFVTSQVGTCGVRGKLDPGHKGYFMFRVSRLFNIAQLTGGVLHLSFFGGAGHLSVLIYVRRSTLLPLEAFLFVCLILAKKALSPS